MSKLSKERLLITSDAPPGKEEDGVVDGDKLRAIVHKVMAVDETPWKDTLFGFTEPAHDTRCGYPQCTSTKDAPRLTKKCKGCHRIQYCSKLCRETASDMHKISCTGIPLTVNAKGQTVTKAAEALAFVGTVINSKQFVDNVMRYAQDQVLIAIQAAFDSGIMRGAFPADMADLTDIEGETEDEYRTRLEKLALRRLALSFMRLRMIAPISRTAANAMERIGLTLEVPASTVLPHSTEDLIYADFRELMLTPNSDLPWIGLHLFATICGFALGTTRALHAVPHLMTMLLLYPMRTPRELVQRSQFFALVEGLAAPCVASDPERTLAMQYREDLEAGPAFSCAYLFYLYPVSDPDQKALAFVLWRLGKENVFLGALPNGMQKVRHWLTVNEHADFSPLSCDDVLARFLPDVDTLTRKDVDDETRQAAFCRCFAMPQEHFILSALTSAKELPVYSVTCCRVFLM